jgi:ADP-heptose:LPS heptosyltransferase
VNTIGATTDEKLRISISSKAQQKMEKKIIAAGVNIDQPWILLHPGVSELKREYPSDLWIETGKLIFRETGYQLLVTGSVIEKHLIEKISNGIGGHAFALAGCLNIEEFISLISVSPLVISVNTGTVHIAAAVQTPVIVLFVLNNPQHTPWQS